MLSGPDTTARPGEQGVALIAALAFIVLVAGIVIGIFVLTKGRLDSTKTRGNRVFTEAVAREASAVLAATYSSGAAGEHNGFLPPRDAVQSLVSRSGGTTSGRVPDDARAAPVASSAAFVVTSPIDGESGLVGNWQLYQVVPPEWGTTPGGRVTAFVRVWTTNDAGRVVGRIGMYRMDLRPSYFADYQMIFDGPVVFGPGVTISGPVHSNGYRSSFMNQYDTLGAQIQLDPSTVCTDGARISSGGPVGGIQAGGTCAGRTVGDAARINLQRARRTVEQVAALCSSGGTTTLNVICLPGGSTPTAVNLGSYAGQASTAGGNNGAVVIVDGPIDLSGTLGAGHRISVISADYLPTPNAAEVIRVTGGSVGMASAGDLTSSVGIVAETDIVVDERVACPATIRGALVSVSGMLSMSETWRDVRAVPGGTMCSSGNPALSVAGSIVGHFPPAVRSTTNNAGFASRTYSYLPALYDNPPPLHPTAGDWEVSAMAPADLSCFGADGQPRLDDRGEIACGRPA